MLARMESPSYEMASIGSSSISNALSLRLNISNLDTLNKKINGFYRSLKNILRSLSVLAIYWFIRNSVRSLIIF